MSRYLEAKEMYAKIGIDTDKAINTLKSVPVSLHCWQGDDVRGFDQKVDSLSGGIQTTGNYPGQSHHTRGAYGGHRYRFKALPRHKEA